MKQKDMINLILTNSISCITLARIYDDETGKQINEYRLECEYYDSYYSQVYGYILMTDKDKEKTYTSLDRAVSFIREIGYQSKIEVV